MKHGRGESVRLVAPSRNHRALPGRSRKPAGSTDVDLGLRRRAGRPAPVRTRPGRRRCRPSVATVWSRSTEGRAAPSPGRPPGSAVPARRRRSCRCSGRQGVEETCDRVAMERGGIRCRIRSVKRIAFQAPVARTQQRLEVTPGGTVPLVNVASSVPRGPMKSCSVADRADRDRADRRVLEVDRRSDQADRADRNRANRDRANRDRTDRDRADRE